MPTIFLRPLGGSRGAVKVTVFCVIEDAAAD
jgi:hypothetical protein